MPQNLPGPKIVEISKALQTVYPDWVRFSVALIPLDVNAGALQLPGVSYEDNLTLIIRDADVEGWLPRLVNVALVKAPGDQTLLDIQKLLKPAELPPGIDCFELCRLGAQVMVNRKEFRKALRDMTQPSGKRILVVRGDRRSGKSHGAQLICHVAARIKTFHYHLVDLEAFSRLRDPSQPLQPLQPLDLARRLVNLLKFKLTLPPRPANARWARWTMKFCDDFEAEACEKKDHLWLVIDGFNSVRMSSGSLDLVKELAYRINTTLTHYHLILLGFDDDLPLQLTLNVANSPTPKLSTLTDEALKLDLITFFDIASHQDGVVVSDEVLAAKVGRVMAKAGPRDENFLLNLAILTGEELQNWAA